MTSSAEKLYLWSDALKCVATLTGVNAERNSVRLSRTLFHPQGGGQPADGGTIAGRRVVGVRHADDADVDHQLEFTDGLAIGQEVELQVDPARRRLHARLHSAGHLISDAAANIAPQIRPRSGHHWPGEARVEFEGEVDDADRFANALQLELNVLLSANIKPETQLGEDGMRRVRFAGAPAPCGGTHVTHVDEIGAIEIRRAQCKRNIVRVSYDVGS